MQISLTNSTQVEQIHPVVGDRWTGLLMEYQSKPFALFGKTIQWHREKLVKYEFAVRLKGN